MSSHDSQNPYFRIALFADFSPPTVALLIAAREEFFVSGDMKFGQRLI